MYQKTKQLKIIFIYPENPFLQAKKVLLKFTPVKLRNTLRAMLLTKTLWKGNGRYNDYIGCHGKTITYFYIKFRVKRLIGKSPSFIDVSFFCGAQTQIGSRPTHYLASYLTYNKTKTYFVRLFGTSNQLFATTSTYAKHNKTRNEYTSLQRDFLA